MQAHHVIQVFAAFLSLSLSLPLVSAAPAVPGIAPRCAAPGTARGCEAPGTAPGCEAPGTARGHAAPGTAPGHAAPGTAPGHAAPGTAAGHAAPGTAAGCEAPAIRTQDDAPSGPRVLLETLAGEVRELPLEGFQMTDPRSAGAAFVRFVGLERPRPAVPSADNLALVTLHGGDRLQAGVRGGTGEELQLTLHGGAELQVSVEEIFSVVYTARLPRDGSADPGPADDGDRLYLRRGRGLDKVDGLINGFDAGGVVFEGRFGERTYPWSEVAALFIERLEESAVEPEPGSESASVPVIVDLEGGGRLSGVLLGMDAEGVRIATHGIADLRLPAALVREVAMDDGSFVFLSALTPEDLGPSDLFGGADDLGMRFPPRMDRNYRGDPLRSGGLEWSRGVGVHAPSRITWNLDGRWKEFRGWVALDDSALENQFHGSVIFRLHLDGELAWESPVVRGGDTPLAIPALQLGNRTQLVLEVDAATEAFVSDRANWLRPILVAK